MTDVYVIIMQRIQPFCITLNMTLKVEYGKVFQLHLIDKMVYIDANGNMLYASKRFMS